MEISKEQIKHSKGANKKRQDARNALPQSIFDIRDRVLIVNKSTSNKLDIQ